MSYSYTEWTGGGSATSTSSSAGSSGNTWVTYRYSTITVNVFLSNGKPTHTVEAAYTENHRDGSSTSYTSVEGEDYSITVTDTDTLYSVTFYSIARGATDDLTRTGGVKTITYTRQRIEDDDDDETCDVCGRPLDEDGYCTGSCDRCPDCGNTPPNCICGKEPQGGGGCNYNHDNGPFSFTVGFDPSYNAGCKDFKWWYVDDKGSQISEAFFPELIEHVNGDGCYTEPISWSLDRVNPGPKYVHAEVTLYNDNYRDGVTIDLGYSSIFQYFAPEFSEDAAPSITTESGKLTLKEPWILSWPAATRVNDNSTVKGYFFCLTNNTTNTNVALKSPEGYPTIGNPANNWYYCSPSSSLEEVEIYIDPAQSGIVPGNEYILYVGAYTQYGFENDGDKCPDPNGTDALEGPAYIYSATYTANNNGVLYVKVDGEWKEGQVFIKTNGTWKEADTVYAYLDDEWKELI